MADIPSSSFIITSCEKGWHYELLIGESIVVGCRYYTSSVEACHDAIDVLSSIGKVISVEGGFLPGKKAVL